MSGDSNNQALKQDSPALDNNKVSKDKVIWRQSKINSGEIEIFKEYFKQKSQSELDIIRKKTTIMGYSAKVKSLDNN